MQIETLGREWKHDDLISDLVNHLMGTRGNRMIWTDTQLGPSGSPRPDIFTLEKSFAKPKPVAYEIKISRADFQRDVVAGKWMSYLQYAGAVYFCLPEGLVKKTEIPEGAGLMVRGEDGWHSLKASPQTGRIPAFEPMMKLLIESHENWEQRTRTEYFNLYAATQKIKKQLGADVATAASDITLARSILAHEHRRIEEAKAQVEHIKAQAKEDGMRQLKWKEDEIERTLRDIRREIGLPDDATHRDVLSKLCDLAAKATPVKPIHLGRYVDRIEQALQGMKDLIAVQS